MRNDSHPTVSLEIVSGHCPRDKRELAGITPFYIAVLHQESLDTKIRLCYNAS